MCIVTCPKDFIRAEKETHKLFEQLIRGEKSAARYTGDDDADTGSSMPWLPIWRALAAREVELLEHKGEGLTSVSEFVAMLPSDADGYNEAYRAAQELCLPFDKSFSALEWNEQWSEARHMLRRESLKSSSPRAHPFADEHAKTPEQLRELLPEKIKKMMEWVR